MTETPPRWMKLNFGYSGTPQQAGDSSMEGMATLSPLPAIVATGS
jgi:hypothetical protein